VLLNLPNPHDRNIQREYAGGFGVEGDKFGEILLPSYLLYASSAVKHSGCEYDVLDAQAFRYDSFQAVDAVKRSEPDVIISWVSLPSIYHDLKLLNQIKKVKPGTLVIALGTVCNVMPEEVLFKSDVDLVVRGWHPYYNLVSNLVDILKRNPLNRDTFNQIDGAIYVNEGKVVQSSVELYHEDLNQLSTDVYFQLPLDKYLAKIPDAEGSTLNCIPIVTGVGCPYSCSYCPYPVGYGRKVIHKSIIRILDEIQFLKTNFGISGFLFREQLFTYDKARVLDLCNEIINRDLQINWYVEARVDQVSEELLSKMKKAGCFRIHYGVETGSSELLRKEGKPGVEIEVIKRTFRMTQELGIATTAHMMLGLPGENWETLKRSLDLLCELNPNSANLNITTPYPGTKLFTMASEQGWISTYDWSKYTSYEAIMGTGEMSADRISQAAKKMRRKFHNFKLLNDPDYRKAYLRSLPGGTLNLFVSSLGRITHKRLFPTWLGR